MDRYLLDQHADMEATHWWFVARRLVIVDVLDRLMKDRPGPQRILDVGCGAGSMLDVLAQRGSVMAIDASPDAVRYVRERHPTVAVALGDLPEGLPPGLRFNVITALDVIEHIPDDVAALTATRGSLIPGGVLICTVPAHQWLWGAHDEINQHKRRYNRRHLVDVLRQAGFVVEWASYFNTVLFPAVASIRLARRLLRRDLAPASDLDVRTGPFNGVLLRMFAAERHVLRRTRLPFGTSLVAVARCPA
jgi:trans-aconitate methyltransferase